MYSVGLIEDDSFKTLHNVVLCGSTVGSVTDIAAKRQGSTEIEQCRCHGYRAGPADPPFPDDNLIAVYEG